MWLLYSRSYIGRQHFQNVPCVEDGVYYKNYDAMRIFSEGVNDRNLPSPTQKVAWYRGEMKIEADLVSPYCF